jgi:hypothetical protein
VARGSDERSVIAFDLRGGSASYLEEDPVTAWALVAGEHIVVTGSAAGAVRARDLDGGRQWMLSGQRGRVLAVAGRSGAPIWSAAEDGTVRGWPAAAPAGAGLRAFLERETSVRIDDDNRLR